MKIKIFSDWPFDFIRSFRPARELAIILFAFAIYCVTVNCHSLFAAPLELDYMEYASDVAAQAAYVSNSSVTTTGGTITEVGGYRIHTFTSNGTFTMNVSTNVEVLIVAGGGGAGGSTGGLGGGGGGGAGGYIYRSSFPVTAQAYTVTVGGGGNGGAPSSRGSSGGNSVFSTLTAIGGGGGGDGANAGTTAGLSGGSGGGAGYKGYTLSTPGNGTAGQGNNGGQNGATSGAGGGGGGGAGGVGGTPTNSPLHNGGVGGAGSSNNISGTSVFYAVGGSGGGSADVGVNGTPNSGNGGSAPYAAGGGGGGGSGGSGIVIIRYPSPLLAYSEASVKNQGSYAIKSSAPVTTSLNKTLTRTVSPTIDLSDRTQIKFDIRSTRTGSNIKIGIRDSGGTTTYITPNITAANEYQTVEWDISSVSNSDKDAIDRIIIQIVNADAANTFYIDNLFAGSIAPAAPTVNRAKAISETSIEWGWQDNSSGGSQEDGFKVYSSTGGLLTTRTADTTFWIETGLKRNKEYSRYVRVYNDAGEADSSTATWRTKPGNYQEKTIVRTGSNAYGGVGDGVIEHNIPVKSGQLATVKVWVRYNTEYGAAEKPTVTLSNLGVSSSQQMSVGSNTWEELTLSGTPSRNGSLLLKIEGLSAAPGARVYADDITVSQ